MVVIINIARVLIHQVFNIVLSIHHQHERNDGELAASTRSQISLAAISIGIDGGNKLFYIACFDGFASLGIHFVGIIIRWIMREIAADYK